MVPANVSAYRAQKEEESAAKADVSLQTVCRELSTNSCAGEKECKGFPELSHQLLILPGSHELPFLTAPKHKELLYSNFHIFIFLYRYTTETAEAPPLRFST